MMEDIQVVDFKKRLESGDTIKLLDVREEWEFEEKESDGRLIPLGELPYKIKELDDWKSEEIVVFCKTGIRSNQAKKFLNQKGFNKVRSLLGGIEALDRA